MVAPGDVIAAIEGPARGLLTGERTALNFLCHLSGVATATASLVSAAQGTKARIVCTRKTTPGLRTLEKYAVRAGGGSNHRFGLDDAVLIKDNHIALAGDVRTAIERAKAHAGHLVKIEVEVDTLSQLEQVLAIGVDAVLLDNMTVEQLRQAVAMTGGRAITEASGRITAETAKAIAATGVDLISAGWLTHSSAALDIGLDYLEFRSANRARNLARRCRCFRGGRHHLSISAEAENCCTIQSMKTRTRGESWRLRGYSTETGPVGTGYSGRTRCRRPSARSRST